MAVGVMQAAAGVARKVVPSQGMAEAQAEAQAETEREAESMAVELMAAGTGRSST